jgi:hypothetical protein
MENNVRRGCSSPSTDNVWQCSRVRQKYVDKADSAADVRWRTYGGDWQLLIYEARADLFSSRTTAAYILGLTVGTLKKHVSLFKPDWLHVRSHKNGLKLLRGICIRNASATVPRYVPDPNLDNKFARFLDVLILS